jgi:hypothetical protein
MNLAILWHAWDTFVSTPAAWAPVLVAISAVYLYFNKSLLGYDKVGMSLSVTYRRQRVDGSGSEDHLAVSVHVKGQSRGAVRLQDAVVLITDADSQAPPSRGIEIREIFRYRREEDAVLIEEDRAGKRRTVKYPRAKISLAGLAPGNPLLNITSEEETEWGCASTVASGRVYIVEAVVLGMSVKGGVSGQWRASTVALPLVDKDKSWVNALEQIMLAPAR